MLTRRGWLTGGFVAVLLVVGRTFGFVEAYVGGAVLASLLVASGLWLTVTRLAVEVSRELRPPKVHAGSETRIDLVVTNRGRRRSPLLTLRDRVSGTRGALLVVNPLAPGAAARAAYRFPTERRGVVSIGPLEVEVADPLGLARLVMPATGISELIVYPLIQSVLPVPLTSGNDPMAGAEHPNALGRSGEDFYTLRAYVVGDDLRRVHWPSTARHDELMVRQDELPWQGRATVVLDVRASRHDDESLERSVSAAASIITAGARRQDLVRYVATDGADSGFAAGHAHVEAVLEHLACVEPVGDHGFARTIDTLASGTTGGALVVLGGHLTELDLEHLARLGRRYGTATAVVFTTSHRTAAHPVVGPPGLRVVEVGPDTTFADAWALALRPSPGRRATAGSRS